MRFSCIIPAYNEWPRIAKVLETAIACDEIDEVIVVNDGSKDNTWKIIDSFTHPKLQKINIEKNGGKAKAILTWVHASKWEYIVMIDSDLLNLTSEHITSLIDPIQAKEADVTLSVRKNSLPFYKWIGSDFVSWERIVPRSLFDEWEYYTVWPGFGLEVKMNEQIVKRNYKIKNIIFPEVITPRKTDKLWYIKWTLADFRMVWEILSVMPIHRICRQLWYFSRFSSK